MEVNGKVYCFFEQSGTFKNEFIKMGIHAEDYDIQNNFGQTDHVIDLFAEIDNAYDNKPSIFDKIVGGDLVIAFFPCIYFCNFSELNQNIGPCRRNSWSKEKMWQWKLDYSRKRQRFYELALKMTAVIEIRNLRMVVENPWTQPTFTNHFWFNSPSIIDNNRTLRGDYFKKPTAYWFINCEPCNCQTVSKTPIEKVKVISKSYDSKDPTQAKKSNRAGICSEERSMISPEYARNFISDFILGKPCGGKLQQPDMFD